MKTLKIVLFLLTLGLGHSQAQINLVPNPSFEDLVTCPNGVAQINKAVGWFTRAESPDLFHNCDTIANSWWNNTGVPFNTRGYQQPLTGNGYAGLDTYGNNFREYISAKLITPLSVGVRYYVSFNISLATGHLLLPYRHADNNQGIMFSMDSLPLTQSINSAHVNNTMIVTDTTNWVNISGSFTADSSYNYITVGNFFSDAFTAITVIDSSATSPGAFYFIDDICVSSDSDYCDLFTSVENIKYNQFDVYPNPCMEFIRIPTCMYYSIHNSTGRLVFTAQYTKSKIDVSFISSGLYIISLFNLNGQRIHSKFLKL